MRQDTQGYYWLNVVWGGVENKVERTKNKQRYYTSDYSNYSNCHKG